MPYRDDRKIQKNNLVHINHVNNYPVAHVCTEHTGQVLAQWLSDGGISRISESFYNTTPQDAIFLGKATRILLEPWVRRKMYAISGFF